MLLSHQLQVCTSLSLLFLNQNNLVPSADILSSQKHTTVKYEYIIQPANGMKPYSNIILGYLLQYLYVFAECLYSHVFLKYLKYYITDNAYEISYIL
jgi:hypothetical protein